MNDHVGFGAEKITGIAFYDVERSGLVAVGDEKGFVNHAGAVDMKIATLRERLLH